MKFIFATLMVSLPQILAANPADTLIRANEGRWRGTEYYVGKFCDLEIVNHKTFVRLATHAINSRGENNDLDLYFAQDDTDWLWDKTTNTLNYQSDGLRFYITFDLNSRLVTHFDWVSVEDDGNSYQYTSCRRLKPARL